MERINVCEPVEPPERTSCRSRPRKFVGGIVLEDHVVAAPIVAYMAKQRWTRHRVQDYCRRRGWSLSGNADDGAQAGRKWKHDMPTR